jgi:hypothetical protein
MIPECDGDTFDDHPSFLPRFKPKTMIRFGIHGGSFFPTEISRCDLPDEWFVGSRLGSVPDYSSNRFAVQSDSSGSNGFSHWVVGADALGWFQWYCRFCLGRRMPDVDHLQISRWQSQGKRLVTTLIHQPSCSVRQSLLEWSHDPWLDERQWFMKPRSTSCFFAACGS